MRLLLEVDGQAQPPHVTIAAVQEAVRVDLGIRVEAVPVPGHSLPRYDSRRGGWCVARASSQLQSEGNFLEVRCRECAREARARGEWVD